MSNIKDFSIVNLTHQRNLGTFCSDIINLTNTVIEFLRYEQTPVINFKILHQLNKQRLLLRSFDVNFLPVKPNQSDSITKNLYKAKYLKKSYRCILELLAYLLQIINNFFEKVSLYL